jgi:hypothetical protein
MDNHNKNLQRIILDWKRHKKNQYHQIIMRKVKWKKLIFF